MAIQHLLLFSGIAAYLMKDSMASDTKGLIEEWGPEDVWDTEADYRSDLADFLRDELLDVYIVEEYGQGRARKDIRIESVDGSNIIAIELKYGLSSANEANRLLGQALRYSSEVDVLFILLINCEPNHLSEIDKYISLNFDQNKIEIIAIEIGEE